MNRLEAIRQRVLEAATADPEVVTATYVPPEALDLVIHARTDIPLLLAVVDAARIAEVALVAVGIEPCIPDSVDGLCVRHGAPIVPEGGCLHRAMWTAAVDDLRAALAPLLEPEQP